MKRCAVIGAGLGGLSTAVHLAAAGYDVTIFEVNERVGGRANRIEKDGFIFDTGPSLLNYPWIFDDLFKAGGQTFTEEVTLLPVDPSIRFYWRDQSTFTLSSRMDMLLDECERIEPGSKPGVLAFFKDAAEKFDLTFSKLVNRNEDRFIRWLSSLSASELVKTSIWRSMDRELSRFFPNQKIREALGAYAMYLGGTPYQLPGIFSILPYGEMAYGLWLPKGGIYGLIEGIENLARSLGVNIITGTPVKQIVISDGRAAGLMFEDGVTRPFDKIISNADVPYTQLNLLPPGALSRSRIKRVNKTVMTPGVITFYWGIRGEVDRLGHHSIFLPDNNRRTFDDLMRHHRMPEDLPFYISLPSETDPDMAPAGDTSMFVLVPTPVLKYMQNASWPDVVAAVKAQVFSRLQLHGLDIDKEQIVVEETYTPLEWQQRFGLHEGSAFGAAHTLFQVGPFRAPNYDEDIKDLYYAGAGTTPGTGMPMVILGGKMTAERILSHDTPSMQRPSVPIDMHTTGLTG